MIDNITAAAILTGAAVFLPSVKRTAPEFDPKEVLTRTGTRIVKPEERSKIALKITRAGLNISPEYFTGIRALIAGAGIILCVLLSLISPKYLWFLFSIPVLYFIPSIILNSKIKARQSAIKISLSEFTVLLAVTLQAGTELLLSIKEASNAIGGPLKEELDKALKDYQSGRPLVDALVEMNKRVNVDELNSLVRTLNQVNQQGGSMAETMQAYSEQMRLVKKFENMEIAGKLAVKLLLPVLFFILVPCMIVIGFPAVYALMGAL